MFVGTQTSSTGPGKCSEAFLANSITIYMLRPTPNNVVLQTIFKNTYDSFATYLDIFLEADL